MNGKYLVCFLLVLPFFASFVLGGKNDYYDSYEVEYSSSGGGEWSASGSSGGGGGWSSGGGGDGGWGSEGRGGGRGGWRGGASGGPQGGWRGGASGGPEGGWRAGGGGGSEGGWRASGGRGSGGSGGYERREFRRGGGRGGGGGWEADYDDSGRGGRWRSGGRIDGGGSGGVETSDDGGFNNWEVARCICAKNGNVKLDVKCLPKLFGWDDENSESSSGGGGLIGGILSGASKVVKKVGNTAKYVLCAECWAKFALCYVSEGGPPGLCDNCSLEPNNLVQGSVPKCVWTAVCQAPDKCMKEYDCCMNQHIPEQWGSFKKCSRESNN